MCLLHQHQVIMGSAASAATNQPRRASTAVLDADPTERKIMVFSSSELWPMFAEVLALTSDDVKKPMGELLSKVRVIHLMLCVVANNLSKVLCI